MNKKDPVKIAMKNIKKDDKILRALAGKHKKKVVKFERYEHIGILNSSRLIRSLLGKKLTWTIKEDGENVSLWLKSFRRSKKSELIISSRNLETASKDIQAKVKATVEFPKILKMLDDNPMFRVVVEECRKGKSVTQIKTYDHDQLFVIAIYDTAIERYLPFTLMAQTCYHYGIPTVKLYSETRHRTIKDLLKFKNHVLEYCDTMKEEGMVCSTFEDDGKQLKAKVKLDIPAPIKQSKLTDGAPIYPQIPVSEIMGSISKVEADYGLTGEAKDDMPRIAAAVSKACKEHLYSSRGNLFQYYKDYMERSEQ
jgi:hypothetical protein